MPISQFAGATRRNVLRSLGLVIAAPAWAAGPASAPAANTGVGVWRMLVNEAVTGETNVFKLTSRYQGFAEYMEPVAKVKEIAVEPIVDIKRFMQMATAKGKPELVFGKSVNQLAKLVRDHGYQPIARRADPYKAAFIVAKDAPFKTLADVGSATIVMPDEFAATSAVARAELRRQKVSPKVTHLKFQEMVAMEVKMSKGPVVGVVNPTVAKKWAEEGGRVLGETQPVVNWSLLAGPQVPAATVAKLREALLAMEQQKPAEMQQMSIKAWAAAEKKDYLDLLAYTQE
jgi:ABC-type phosphate/phosphonate transport system substrate-binding protein